MFYNTQMIFHGQVLIFQELNEQKDFGKYQPQVVSCNSQFSGLFSVFPQLFQIIFKQIRCSELQKQHELDQRPIYGIKITKLSNVGYLQLIKIKIKFGSSALPQQQNTIRIQLSYEVIQQYTALNSIQKSAINAKQFSSIAIDRPVNKLTAYFVKQVYQKISAVLLLRIKHPVNCTSRVFLRFGTFLI